MKLIDTFTIYRDYTDDIVSSRIDDVVGLVKSFCGYKGSGGLWPVDGEKCLVVEGAWGELCKGDIYRGPQEVESRIRKVLKDLATLMQSDPEETAGGEMFAHTTLTMLINGGLDGKTEITFTYKDEEFCKIMILPTTSYFGEEDKED